MKIELFKLIFLFLFAPFGSSMAQNYNVYSSTEAKVWQSSKAKLQVKSVSEPIVRVDLQSEGTVFKAWGTCFNELGWDALNLLSGREKDEILSKLFAPGNDLGFSIGRIPMNASDYARDWYSCDEVPGDFQLLHFNIHRDKQVMIPYVKSAQRVNPDLKFWISPWSPPSWMKVNNYYSCRSDRYNKMNPESDLVLFEGETQKDQGVFPQTLAVNDYFIQDPRYLKSYANYFVKFIDAYKEQGIPINMVMYQNEAYSYTPYPGCAWTAEGTIRFNSEYLAPTLKKAYPDVELILGTINTNRYDYIDKILSDSTMLKSVSGVGFQWEGGQIIPRIREKYPKLRIIQTESECGWGSFDWKGAEHTFGLINHYLGNGTEEYTFWNAILSDDGLSTWGWKQNALIRVNSKEGNAIFTPEYYAVKHYTHFVRPGSKIIAYSPSTVDKTPVMVVVTPENKFVVIAGNFNEIKKEITVEISGKYLNFSLLPHSFVTAVN